MVLKRYWEAVVSYVLILVFLVALLTTSDMWARIAVAIYLFFAVVIATILSFIAAFRWRNKYMLFWFVPIWNFALFILWNGLFS